MASPSPINNHVSATSSKNNNNRLAPSSSGVETFNKLMSNKVGIAAYKTGGEKGTFEGRIKRLNVDKQYTVHTGKAFINSLEKASIDKPITKLIIGSHGSGSGIYMDSNAGLYGDTLDKYGNSLFYNFSFELPSENARTLSDIKTKIESGDIRFAENAEIYILGCKTANHTIAGIDGLAEEFSEIAPNTFVVGSTNRSNPDPMKSNPKLDSNNYYSRGSGGEWHVYHKGKKTQIIKNPLNPNKVTINKK